MSLKPIRVVEEQTGAITVPIQFPVEHKKIPATIFATNLGVDESVAILFSTDGGKTFEPHAQDGVDLVMTETANAFSINAPILIGITKTATAAPVGVFIMTTNVAR